MAAKFFRRETPWKNVAAWIGRSADGLIWALIACYVISFTWLTWHKYFAFGYHDWDLASDVIVLWNSIHGRLLHYPFLEQSIFGAHLYLIIFLLIPLFALCQSPLFLLFLQSLFLGLAAFPLYLFASSKLDKGLALAVCAVYLLYPSVGFINLFETHFEIYAIFFLFFAFYFFERERFGWFLCFLLLALACKENLSFVVFMFGVYALMRRRPWKWVLFPAALGAAWFAVAVKLVIPYFAKDARLYQDGFIFSIYYQHLGKTIGEMARTIVSHPVAMFRYAFGADKGGYLFYLLAPTGFLGLLSPLAMVLILPVLAQNLLSSAWSHSQIHYQYVASMIPPIFVSVVFGLRRLTAQPQLQRYRGTLLLVFLACPLVWGKMMGAPQSHFPAYARGYRVDDLARAKAEIVRAIPPGASVMASFQFLSHLADRRELHSIHLVSTGYRMYTKTRYEPPPRLEYVLIDFNEPLLIGSFFPPQAPENLRMFLEDGRWGFLQAIDDVVLFKKGSSDGPRLCEVFENPSTPPSSSGDVSLGGKIGFLGYDVAPGRLGRHRTLSFQYYWHRLHKVERPLGVLLQFFDKDERLKFEKLHVWGYRVYSPDAWAVGRIIRERHTVLVPAGIAPGAYGVYGTLFFLDTGEILSAASAEKVDPLGRFFIGRVEI